MKQAHATEKHRLKQKNKNRKAGSQLQLAESQRYPNLFRWKVGALVVVILIVILGIIDIVLKVYLDNNPQPPINASFVNNIVQQTEIIKQGSQIGHLMVNMLRADNNLYFQESELVTVAPGENFTSDAIKNQIFRNHSKNVMFIFEVRKVLSMQLHTFGIFVAANFPIPAQDSYNQSIDYYTFEHGDNRLSIVFSLQNNQILSMNASTDKIFEPKLQSVDNIKCKTYFLSQKQNYFGIMSLFKATLDSSPVLSLMDLKQSYACFDKVVDQADLVNKLNKIMGFNIVEQEITINKYQVYHLRN